MDITDLRAYRGDRMAALVDEALTIQERLPETPAARVGAELRRLDDIGARLNQMVEAARAPRLAATPNAERCAICGVILDHTNRAPGFGLRCKLHAGE